jgi:hypothetical protein
MKNTSRPILMLVLVSLIVFACSPAAPTESVPPVETPVSQASPDPGVERATSTAVSATVVAPSVTPTPQVQLEVVQSQTWTDRDGHLRVNVLVRNPYEFPVAPAFRGRASLLDSTGEFIRDQPLYFLDGISGGNGFVLPGETVAANACFTCEREPLTEDWSSVAFRLNVEDASTLWSYFADVEASVGTVSFNGDSPIFDVSGTVKNNTSEMLNRISARVFVFDGEGNLVGAAEASAWDVGPGATANFSGYGIGQAPTGPVTYEVSALGVKY